MYKVIAANRGPSKPPKNWRIFEKENMEKHFGPVLDVNGEDGHSVYDAFKEYKDTIEYIRWYPCPESCTEEEYNELLKRMPTNVDWSKLGDYEKEDNTLGTQSLNCTGDVCEVVDIT